MSEEYTEEQLDEIGQAMCAEGLMKVQAVRVRQRLTRSAIRPSIPVQHRGDLPFSDLPALKYAGMLRGDEENVTILIPAPLVMQWARDRLDMNRPYTDADWMDWWEDKIAHYTAHGEGESTP